MVWRMLESGRHAAPRRSRRVIGDPRRAATRALARAVVELGRPGERYPDLGKPAVYLCTPTACSAPITEPERFDALADAFVRSSLPARPTAIVDR